MIHEKSRVIIVNGVELPPCSQDLEIITSVVVDSGRNANGTVVGQVIGRPLWKLNNLQWNGLLPYQWERIKKALKPFYVTVEFTGDDNERHKITMYHGDITAQPFYMDENCEYLRFKTCKVNLIDVGKPGED